MQHFISRTVAVFSLFGILMLSAGSALASEPSAAPQSLRWRNAKLSISVSRKTSPNIDGNAAEAVTSAAASWMRAAGVQIDVVETDAVNVSPKGARGDGVSLLTFAATAENLKLFPKQGSSPAASTRLFFDRLGYITEADIVLNPFLQFSSNGTFGTYDLESVITHEIGHLLGLRHVPAMGAVMYDRFGKNSFPASRTPELTTVDQAAVRAIYGSRLTDDTECCGSVSGSVVDNVDEAVVWLEESSTGRVAAAIAVTDGKFAIGGLVPDSYRLYFQAKTKAGERIAGHSDIVIDVASDTEAVVSDIYTASNGLIMIGQIGQLGRLPLRLSRGSSTQILLGVETQDGRPEASPVASTPNLTFGIAMQRGDFRGPVKVLGAEVTVDRNTPAGLYSISVTGSDETHHTLIGAVVVSE